MFTGLIADVGTCRLAREQRRRRADRPRHGLAGELAPGDSIAVNGVCLTATEVGGGGFTAQAMIETLRALARSARWRPARASTLSSLCAPQDRLGGHVVQGHVDGLGTLERR